MKLRVIGTKAECEVAKAYFGSLSENPATKYVTVSEFYPCRGSAALFRVYIEIEYYDAIDGQTEEKKGHAGKLDLRTLNDAHLSAKGLGNV